MEPDWIKIEEELFDLSKYSNIFLEDRRTIAFCTPQGEVQIHTFADKSHAESTMCNIEQYLEAKEL